MDEERRRAVGQMKGGSFDECPGEWTLPPGATAFSDEADIVRGQPSPSSPARTAISGCISTSAMATGSPSPFVPGKEPLVDGSPLRVVSVI
jgi:hypothetical protein